MVVSLCPHSQILNLTLPVYLAHPQPLESNEFETELNLHSMINRLPPRKDLNIFMLMKPMVSEEPPRQFQCLCVKDT